MEFEKKDAQEDYENSMGDAKAKRAEDSKSQSGREGALAETTGEFATTEAGSGIKQISFMERDWEGSGRIACRLRLVAQVP